MFKKSVTHYIAKIVIDVLFCLSLICTAAVPFVSSRVFEWIGYHNADYATLFTVFVFLSGLCCSYILYNLHKMFISLLVGNPFTEKNVSHFRKIAVSCALISAIYIIKCFFIFTFATIVIAAVFAVCCLLCLTLKDLFKQAINYKTENDLTI